MMFGDPYYGPGSPSYDYSSPVQTDYTDPASNMGPTYPGAGSTSTYLPAVDPPLVTSAAPLIIADAPLVPSSPSDWSLPNFVKASPMLAIGVAAVVGAGLLYAASRSAPRRRRRSRS